MIKTSVIVPCYNAETYLRECVESILSQTLRKIEVIFVDDGSTDCTLDILEEYQKKFDNIKLMRQENQGSGIARNQGIKVAEGEYIAFMDADDFYPAPTTLEKLYTTAVEKGAVICGGSACNYREGAYTFNGLDAGHLFSEDGWIDKRDFPTSGGYWRFIFNSDFLKKRGIFFPDYLRFQDPPFFLETIAQAGRVYCLKEVTYVHRKAHRQAFFTKERAIGYAKGIRDCLMISQREGMSAAYLQVLSLLPGVPSACMYLFAEKCSEMQDIIHQINRVIADNSGIKTDAPQLKEGEELSYYLRDVQEEKKKLLERLKQENKILIYGAGVMGKKANAFFSTNGIAIEAFVVSNVEDNAAWVDGLQVKGIDEYVNERKSCTVIIATYPAQQEEIRKLLWEKGFEKVYPLLPEKYYLFEGKVSY